MIDTVVMAECVIVIIVTAIIKIPDATELFYPLVPQHSSSLRPQLRSTHPLHYSSLSAQSYQPKVRPLWHCDRS